MKIADLLQNYNTIAFTGSRTMVEGQAEKIDFVLANSAPEILVGDARGIDQYIRENCTTATVFKVSDYWSGNIQKAAFAVRSQAMVKSLSSKNGLLVGFPSSPCPEGLKISKNSFSGYGSGTWATLAYALALNVDCLLWLPDKMQPPQQWGLVAAGDGWWSSVSQSDHVSNKYQQLSLF
ncbi:hypothetical protein I8748_20095 [Nostoc sp. CENA67]|uniref:Uncharacterized protein n=1 Tax=Amazonocrinis nigriterrae CENA67 TaxID=2794033 RepID=A0A8J7HVX8_9NOST|nr:hypothetical protein [Amazonocrinis nigriterrae]MBH8564455.1 hypothetical protein [Amazonocrinis nigriterrae CENA67]